MFMFIKVLKVNFGQNSYHNKLKACPMQHAQRDPHLVCTTFMSWWRLSWKRGLEILVTFNVMVLHRKGKAI